MSLTRGLRRTALIALTLLTGVASNAVTAESRSSGYYYTYRQRPTTQTRQYARPVYSYQIRRPTYGYQYPRQLYSYPDSSGVYQYYHTNRFPFINRPQSQLSRSGAQPHMPTAPIQGLQGSSNSKVTFPPQTAPIPGLQGPSNTQGTLPSQGSSNFSGQPGYQSQPGYQGQLAQTAYRFTCRTASLTCAVPQRGLCECEDSNRVRQRGATVN